MALRAAILIGTVLLSAGGMASSGGVAARARVVDVARLRSLIASPEAMAPYVDKQRGLLLVLHHGNAAGGDPRAGDDGRVRVAERLCGARLETELVALRRTLATRLDRPASEGGVVCATRTCRFGAAVAPPGQARAGVLIFREGGPAGVLLEAVVMREPEEDAVRDAAAAHWIDGRLRALAGGTCGRR